MNYRKSKSWMTIAAVAACVVGMAVVLTACQEAEPTGYVTYEFETFDGETVKIDETNIVSQETEENVLETSKVPEDAEVIAPGRDYVYLADESYYYVEDATSDLLTIAKADAENKEYVTYEFETFDGETVKIDETNIVSQETEENVLETSKVPEDAEVIAPGRDYVYLADENYYYVEDATSDLLTVASR